MSKQTGINDSTCRRYHSFNHEECLLELIDYYVKDEALLIGGYLLFKNFNINSLIKEKYRNNFRIHHIKNIINKLNYKQIDECLSVVLNHGGKYENFFTEKILLKVLLILRI